MAQAGLTRLEAAIARHASAVVAFSGGVDSALVALVAWRVLGDRMLAVTAVSPSLAPHERADAAGIAAELGLPHRFLETAEMDNPAYTANPVNRCYFCKQELYTKLGQLAEQSGFAVVLDGFNHDDRRDHRPGQQAAREHAAQSPLAEAELGKAEVRAIARRLGLRVWDKPASPCLSSRIPYGTPVTHETLARIDAGEQVLRGLGFASARVRHHGEVARLEVPAAELAAALEQREALVAGLKAAGYHFVALDLEGYRTGSLNVGLG
ncbi:MAG: ATP-dependent sacrificial sulfur transferase LarE [Candidatus Sericytochromatia bacterium]|nr:ATP-dependent sacrificial sulfur transferase LarE [Candidatus Sericytochromatia bacterium]